MWRRAILLAIGQAVVVVGLMAGPASAQVESTTTTTSAEWQTVTPPARSAACSWEWGGVPETTPARCDDLGEVTLPVWLLVGVGFLVLTNAALLVIAFRR